MPTGSAARVERPRVPATWGLADLLCIVVLLGIGAWLRGPGLSLGYTSDELANVMPVSAWEIATDPEAGVNPPLFRLLFNVPFSDFQTPWVGRQFSFLCSLLGIALAYVAGREAGRGQRVSGVLAGLLMVWHPIAIQWASIYRIYAWWVAMMLWHVYSMARAIDAEEPKERRRWGIQAVVSAVLLPWIHYFSVPVLLGLGLAVLLGMPGHRRWLGVYLASALAIVPMVPAVLFQEGRRVPPMDTPESAVADVVGLGLTLPLALANVVGRQWRALYDAPFHWPTWTALLFGAILFIQLLLWRRSSTIQRLVVAGFWSMTLGTYALAHVQTVRDPTVFMMLVFLAPGLAAAPAWLPWTWARAGGAAVLVWLVGSQLPERLEWFASRGLERNGPPVFVQDWRRWDDVRQGRSIRIHPGYFVPTLYFYQAHEHFRHAAWDKACEPYNPCYVWEEVVFAGLDAVEDGSRYDGLLVSFDPFPPDGFASTCAVLEDASIYRIFDCRKGQP